MATPKRVLIPQLIAPLFGRIPRNVMEGRTMATGECAFRLRWFCSVLLLVAPCVLVLLRGSGGLSAQSSPQSSHDLLDAKRERFSEYAGDFNDFTKSALGIQDEFERATDLTTVASETEERLDGAILLLDIYGKLSCKEDRARVKPLVALRVSYYGQMMEVSIKQANLDISGTQRPGVAAEATRMRDDLREAKNILDSIRLR